MRSRTKLSQFLRVSYLLLLTKKFFGGFRCGVWLCFVTLVRYKNRKEVKIDV